MEQSDDEKGSNDLRFLPIVTTLHNVCAVHQGVCSTTGDLSALGGYHEYSGGIS